MKIPEPNHSIQSLIDKHHESLAASCACCFLERTMLLNGSNKQTQKHRKQQLLELVADQKK